MQNTYLGGGLGRKGLDHAALEQATELSKRTGRPVQVIWDRATDIQHDQYRPAAHYSLVAGLDAAGDLDALDARIATPSLRRALFPDYYTPGAHEPPASYSLHDFAYAVDNLHVQWHEAELPIPVGYWRAVGRSNCPFATESFIDELAHAAGADPVLYRRRHLSEKQRHLAVLDAAAAAADWDRPRGENRGLGIAVQDGWGSVCAQVAQVSVIDETLEVEHIWAAVACGRLVNPDIVRAQIESGILDALGAALEGGIAIEEGAVVHGNFNDYPVMRMRQAPPIDVVLVDSVAHPGGVGELGVPACAPAVANALFAATGYRARSLPLSRHAPFANRPV
jgi:isoquinoline 1-oxidoreductase beta subunit